MLQQPGPSGRVCTELSSARKATANKLVAYREQLQGM